MHEHDAFRTADATPQTLIARLQAGLSAFTVRVNAKNQRQQWWVVVFVVVASLHMVSFPTARHTILTQDFQGASSLLSSVLSTLSLH